MLIFFLIMWVNVWYLDDIILLILENYWCNCVIIKYNNKYFIDIYSNIVIGIGVEEEDRKYMWMDDVDSVRECFFVMKLLCFILFCVIWNI